MLGFLDELNQAFLTLELGHIPLDFQIDTGFNGTLAVGEKLFDPAYGIPTGTMKAELADEHVATYDTYDVVLPWFGEEVQVQIPIGPGKLCLLGTDLLHPHRLEIDYGEQTVHLVPKPDWWECLRATRRFANGTDVRMSHGWSHSSPSLYYNASFLVGFRKFFCFKVAFIAPREVSRS